MCLPLDCECALLHSMILGEIQSMDHLQKSKSQKVAVESQVRVENGIILDVLDNWLEKVLTARLSTASLHKGKGFYWAYNTRTYDFVIRRYPLENGDLLIDRTYIRIYQIEVDF